MTHATPAASTVSPSQEGVDIQNLSLTLDTENGPLDIVRGVDLRVPPGRVMGIVGESGSGKSMTILSALRMLPEPPAVVTADRLSFGGTDIRLARRGELGDFRGGTVGMIFQDPLTTLNPVLSIGRQISESLQYHGDLNRRQRRTRTLDLLDRVKIDDPVARYSQYPHEFSGGMRQRVGIAMAIANEPKVLVADEPTTALDVTVQAEILDLMISLVEERDMAVVFITHDLGVIAEVADDVSVMYGGQIVERGPVSSIFAAPRHPYTVGLLRSRPARATGGRRLTAIPGQPPQPMDGPVGCPFEPRCFLGHGREICRTRNPPLTGEAGHRAACHFQDELREVLGRGVG